MILRCQACGMMLSAGGHAHVCPTTRSAETIANDLMQQLKSGRIKKIDINTIRRACYNVENLADQVLRLVVYKVG